MQMIPLRVADVRPETAEATTILFDDYTGALKGFLPGQFLTLCVPIDGRELRRSYSISTRPDELPRIGVTVKRVKNGVVSNYIATQVNAGSDMRVIEPIGHFVVNNDWPANTPLVFFGGGSGVTPIHSIITTLRRTHPERELIFYSCHRNHETVLFKNQFDALAESSEGKLKVRHILSQPTKPHDDHTGRMDARKAVMVLLEDHVEVAQAQYFVCGPEGMMNAVQEGLKQLGVDGHNIHKENFYHHSPAEAGASEEDGEPNERLVIVRYNRVDHEVVVQPDESILTAALEAGIDLPYACQMGICGMCRCKLAAGEVRLGDQEALSEEEIEAGETLTCIGYPKGEGVIVDYD